MQKTNIQYNKEARNQLHNGLNKVANAVKATLGPGGSNVLIEQPFGIHTTKDGVTVAKSIHLEDAVENLAAQVIKEVASKSESAAGDGTTTATVLAQEIFNTGLEYVNNSDFNAIEIKDQLKVLSNKLIKILRDKSEEIKDGQIEQIATVSANGDIEMGKIIAKVISIVGRDGIASVEDNVINETEVETTEGMEISQGYVAPHLVTDPNKMEAIYSNARLLIIDGSIDDVNKLSDLLKSSYKNGFPLIIMADQFDNTVIGTVIQNKMSGKLRCCLIKNPSFGEDRKETLKDIAMLTNSTVISLDAGDKIEDITMDNLGIVKTIRIKKDSTIFINDEATKENIESRINEIRTQMENTANKRDLEKLQMRLGKLTGGIAIIKVGGDTELEIREKKDRIDDALSATRSALEEGILPGGGIAILKAFNELEVEDTPAYKILKKAVNAPLKYIVDNVGGSSKYVIEKVLADTENFNYGYDARNKTYGDMKKMGIIDPTKVVRSSLEAAVSISGLLLTTEVTISLIPEIDSNCNLPPM